MGQWPPDLSSSISNINEQILIEPYKQYFSIGEKIIGIYKNVEFEKIYVIHPHGGGDSPLQLFN